jgi:hypothetical protein
LSGKSLQEIREIIGRQRDWLRQNLPGCSYGIGRVPGVKDKFQVALRVPKITPEITRVIAEFRARLNAEGCELEVCEIGCIKPR